MVKPSMTGATSAPRKPRGLPKLQRCCCQPERRRPARQLKGSRLCPWNLQQVDAQPPPRRAWTCQKVCKAGAQALIKEQKQEQEWVGQEFVHNIQRHSMALLSPFLSPFHQHSITFPLSRSSPPPTWAISSPSLLEALQGDKPEWSTTRSSHSSYICTWMLDNVSLAFFIYFPIGLPFLPL